MTHQRHVFCVLLLAACASDARLDDDVALESSGGDENVAAPSPAETITSSSDVDAQVETGTNGDVPPRDEDLFHDIGVAAESAQDAEGGSRCNRAYAGAIAMVEALEQRSQEQAPNVPPRETFISLCEELPQSAQSCMLMEYVLVNQERCRAEARSEAMQRFRRNCQRATP